MKFQKGNQIAVRHYKVIVYDSKGGSTEWLFGNKIVAIYLVKLLKRNPNNEIIVLYSAKKFSNIYDRQLYFYNRLDTTFNRGTLHV